MAAGGDRRDALHQDNRAIRRDQITGSNPPLGAPVADYLARMEALRLAANRMLMLGLFDYEAHFAAIAAATMLPIAMPSPGAQPPPHLGVLPNNDWQPQAGGVLRMYDDDEQF